MCVSIVHTDLLPLCVVFDDYTNTTQLTATHTLNHCIIYGVATISRLLKIISLFCRI